MEPPKEKRVRFTNQVMTQFFKKTNSSHSTPSTMTNNVEADVVDQVEDAQINLVEEEQVEDAQINLVEEEQVEDAQINLVEEEQVQAPVENAQLDGDIAMEVDAQVQDVESEGDDSEGEDILVEPTSSKVVRSRIEVDILNLPSDPGLRPSIFDYDPNDREMVRRTYLQRGPCQPFNHKFPITMDGKNKRSFKSSYFTKYASWLEYSINKNVVFCLPCYLFRPKGGDDSFINDGFSSWKNMNRIENHVGGLKSAHNEASMKSRDLMKQEQHLETLIIKQSSQDRINYRIRLNASVDVVRFLLRQGLPFRGHDESPTSINRGNYIELLQFLADHNEIICNVVLENAPRNDTLTSPQIQKELVSACALETLKVIMKDLGDELFAVLIDEARDVSIKEQMAIVLRYVDKKGFIIERFVGVIHVLDTSAISLKSALEDFLGKHGLSISRLRGQGYDGASNMQGKFNGLQALILDENKSAFYIHCFAHQLQLALVNSIRGVPEIESFFSTVTSIVNVVVVSCKRRDNLRGKEIDRIREGLETGELSSGRGKNQEMGLNRPGDTRWGSHYGTLVNLIVTFSSVTKVLDDVVRDGSTSAQRNEASNLLDKMHSFEFIFNLHMMKKLLSFTNDLSKALQREDQNIVNALTLVRISKSCLQKMRESGWDALLVDVSQFSVKHNVFVLQMDAQFVPLRSQRHYEASTNLHYYRAWLLYRCIDRQSAELDRRFNEVNSELLLCMSAFSPSDVFTAFNNEKLVRLAEFYPFDFSEQDRMDLQAQLEIYEIDMKSNDDFLNVKGIDGLAKKMVEKGKDIVYDLVYKLIKMALILPVATATVERAFSAMSIVKDRLRNRMGDEWMNDSLITYIEKDIFDNTDTEEIMQRFQRMGPTPRRGQL